jgi:hypothetical protein
MDAAARFFGSAISLAGTLCQLGVIAATIPRFPTCLCRGGDPGPVTSISIWQPFIDNPRAGDGRSAAEPRCPARGGTGAFYSVAAAPMPPFYDPYAYSEKALYACVLLTGGGKMLDARLLRGTGEAALDRDLISTIRGAWRFRSYAREGRAPSWQRVRLNPGPWDRDVAARMLPL